MSFSKRVNKRKCQLSSVNFLTLQRRGLKKKLYICTYCISESTHLLLWDYWYVTRFQMGKGYFSGEQLPQTEGVAEHVCLHRVASTLREHFRSHPTQVLDKNTIFIVNQCSHSNQGLITLLIQPVKTLGLTLFLNIKPVLYFKKSQRTCTKWSPITAINTVSQQGQVVSHNRRLPRDVAHLTVNCSPSTLRKEESAQNLHDGRF